MSKYPGESEDKENQTTGVFSINFTTLCIIMMNYLAIYLFTKMQKEHILSFFLLQKVNEILQHSCFTTAAATLNTNAS